MTNIPLGDISLGLHTASEAVANQLRTLILKRTLKPGDRLMQKELAAQLGVSRTPVREALYQLASEGLVTISPYRGATVVELAPNDLEEIYHVRIALEAYAARLAARHITDEEIQQLKVLVADMKIAFDQHEPDRLLEINRRFYLRLYQATQQQRLYEMIVSHLDLSRQYRRIYFYLEHLATNTIKEHEELIETIESRDEEMVERLIRQGLEATLAGLIQSLES